MLVAYAMSPCRAERYLKALCNHFNRKVTASYKGNRGMVHALF